MKRANLSLIRALGWTSCLVLGLALASFCLYHWELRQVVLDEGGYWSDIYPRWYGSRELLWHGRNPYAPDVTVEIQRGFYGHPLGPADDRHDKQAFAYPLLVVPLMAPFTMLPFEAAAPLMMAAMSAALAAGLFTWSGALLPVDRRWRAGATLVPFLSLPVLEALIYQQLSLLTVALAAIAAAELRRGRLLRASLALGILSFKPQLAALPLAGLSLWALAAPRARRAVLLVDLALLTLIAVSEAVILPGWTHGFLAGVRDYSGYVLLDATLLRFFGRGALAAAIAAALIGGCLWLWWRSRASPCQSQAVLHAYLASVTVTAFIVPEPATYQKALLLVPLLPVLAQSGAAEASLAWWQRRPRSLARQLIILTYLFPAAAGLVWQLSPVAAEVMTMAGLSAWQFFLPTAALALILVDQTGSLVQLGLPRIDQRRVLASQ